MSAFVAARWQSFPREFAIFAAIISGDGAALLHACLLFEDEMRRAAHDAFGVSCAAAACYLPAGGFTGEALSS